MRAYDVVKALYPQVRITTVTPEGIEKNRVVYVTDIKIDDSYWPNPPRELLTFINDKNEEWNIQLEQITAIKKI